jgi:PilZ domain
MPQVSEAVQPAPPPAAERRRAPRHLIIQRCYVRLAGVAGPGGWRGIAYNISTTGIGVALPEPLWPGVSVVVEPCGLAGGRPLRARVAHVRPLDWAWLCGCALAEPLSDRDLRAWLAGG